MSVGAGDLVSTWPFIATDYKAAVVRLATVSARRVQHLVWGAVELVPIEVPVPSTLTDHWSNAPGTDLTLVYSQTVTSVREGLEWYAAALGGRLHVPLRAGTIIQTAAFAPEPAWGTLITDGSAPFAAPWQDSPRLHRLVPLSEVADEVVRLRGDGAEERIGATQRARQRAEGLARSRAWFARRMGFDVFLWDDWLGALALGVPNPLCRGLLTSIIDRCSKTGAETILVEAEPREGADLSTLTVEFIERRADGWARVEPVPLDAYGRGIVALGQRSGSAGLVVRCSTRGLLAYREPLPWLRAIDLSMGFASRRVQVAVPAGGRARPATKQDATFYDVERSTVGEPHKDTGESRLARLVRRRNARRETVSDTELIFMPGERERAVTFIRGCLGRAARRAIVVDPFVGPRDLYEFGIQSRRRGISTTFLRSSSGLNEAVDYPDLGNSSLGSVLQAQEQYLRKQLGADAPAVLLMNGLVFHDRLLVVDDAVWVMGHSLNHVGLGEISTIARLRSPEPMLALVEEAIRQASPLETWSLPTGAQGRAETD